MSRQREIGGREMAVGNRSIFAALVAAIVGLELGHFDRTGGGNTSWNSAHPSAGCSQDNLIRTGGNGYFYCFASN